MKHMRTLRIGSALIAIIGIGLVCWLIAMKGEAYGALVERCYGYGFLQSYSDKLPLPTRWQLALAAFPWVFVAAAIALFPRLTTLLHNALVGSWRLCRDAMRGTWARMPLWERAWFVAALVGCAMLRTYFAATDPPVFDEALNWLLFAERGPLVSLTWYAAPNNHIGATVLTAIVGLLPIEPLVALRVPAVIAALLLQVALYVLLRRFSSPMSAVLASAFAIASPMMLYYDHVGRGYVWVALAFTIAMGAALKWLLARDERGLWLTSLACMAGTFVMPSFLYATAGLFIALLILDRDRRRVLNAAVWSAIGIAALYAPALIVSGMGAFADNQWVRPVGMAEVAHAWWPHFNRTFEGLTGIPRGFVVVLLLLGACTAIVRKPLRSVAAMVAIIVGSALLTPFIHGVLPFERTWIYLIAPLVFSVALVADRGLARYRFPQLAIPVALVLIMVQTKRVREALPVLERDAYRVMEATALLRSERPERIRAWAQPLSTYLFFAWKRGQLPEGCDFDFSSTTEVEPGTFVIGRKSEFDPGRGDRMVFTYEGADAIWVTGPKP